MAGGSAHATLPGANGEIAFGRTIEGQSDIWVVDPKTGTKTRLTDTGKKREMMPDWSSDGSRLAFARCGIGEFTNCDIWVMEANGTGATRLTTTPQAQETWPTWSPDGTRIAFTSNEVDLFQDVWVMDSDGTDATLLTPGSEVFDAFPEWSPDGTKLAFTSSREASNDIWVMNPDGTDLDRLTTGDMKIDERPDWSPDGERIVFSRDGDIRVMNSDGSGEMNLTSNNRHEFNPTFSPNGKRIAYNRTGKRDRTGVWTVRADGSRPKQHTFGLFDFFPDWRPLASE